MNMENTNGDTCAVKIKRKQGGQPGNQNARIHGFYSKTLDAEERADYEEARNIQGLDEEIALMRAKIKSVLRHAPDNHKVLMLAMATLCRVLMTHYHITKGDKKGFKEGLSQVLRDVALPLGIGLGGILDK
jgi:hypothetical protein